MEGTVEQVIKSTALPDEGVYTIELTSANYVRLIPGKIEYDDGSRYEGDIRKGRREGRGTLSYSSGDKYVGEWKADKREGWGRLDMASGGYYEGEWQLDRMHGMGTEVFPDKCKYEGEYREGLMHGKGKLTYPPKPGMEKGLIYEGQFVRDVKEGKGKIFYPDSGGMKGDVFDGQFLGGKRHGPCLLTYAGVRQYKAEFRNDQMVGQPDYVGDQPAA
eukprot:TRINITY_DN12823_c0_g1_i1.p2 TRINITY_DN12823_c0_g1~~TRINITY_DN12823_c0_g1_i1.p2  ORF type:complete len:217 (+),score=60.93 TRINITY_DN12823_c0_g1_i1:108-758(+)